MTNPPVKWPIIIGISGASGSIMARRAVELLGEELKWPLDLIVSRAAVRVWKEELGESFEERVRQWQSRMVIRRFNIDDIGCELASGRKPKSGMIIIPCSMATVSALATGASTNLLQRAADVHLKEGRPLTIVPRETPLSMIHLRNLLTLAEMGVRVFPPMPAFYTIPSSVDEVVDYLVKRAVATLGHPELQDL